MSSDAAVFDRLRTSTATLLGYNVANLSPQKALRLDRVAFLRLELDRMQSAQAAGQAIDLHRIASVSEQLEALLPADEDKLDLSALTNAELRTFEELIAKAMGIAPPTEEPDPYQEYAAGIAKLTAELAELREANARLTFELATERDRNARAEAAAKVADEARAAAETRLAEVVAPPPRDQPPRIVVDNEPSAAVGFVSASPGGVSNSISPGWDRPRW